MTDRCASCDSPTCGGCTLAIRRDMEAAMAGKIGNLGGKKAPPFGKGGKKPPKGK